VTEVYEKYKNDVKFRYTLFPLPYHTWAFLLAKSVQAVDLLNGDVFSFIDAAYVPANQAMIYNSATADSTVTDVQSMVATWVTNSTAISLADYNDSMANDANVSERSEPRAGLCHRRVRHTNTIRFFN